MFCFVDKWTGERLLYHEWYGECSSVNWNLKPTWVWRRNCLTQKSLCENRKPILGADSGCANIETWMLSSKQHGVNWFSFIVYVLYKSLCEIKSCQNFTPKRDASTFVSFKWEFPQDEWALPAFSKKRNSDSYLVHRICRFLYLLFDSVSQV